MSVNRSSLTVLALLGLDAVGVALAYASAIATRLALNELFERQFSLEDSFSLMPPLLVMLPIYLAAFAFTGVYSQSHEQSASQILLQAIRGSTLAIMLVVLGAFFFSRSLYSRSLVLILWLSSILVVWLLRTLVSSKMSRPSRRESSP